MKKNMTLKGILVFIAFGTAIFFTGCVTKYTVVNDDVVQEPKVEATKSSNTEIVQAAKAPADQEQATKVEAKAEEMQAVKVAAAATEEINIRDIHFDYDSYSIRPDAREILKGIAKILLKKDSAEIIIEGHSDEPESAEYNLALGERRAQEAKRCLISLGVKEPQIKTVSYGIEFPLGHNEKAFARNRRVHFIINVTN
jgi:peptidoglycan-associated lipoprotein